MLNALIPLGERLFDHSDQLREAGFTAWTVYYENSIAGCSDADIGFHRKFLIEVAKEEVGNLHHALGGRNRIQIRAVD